MIKGVLIFLGGALSGAALSYFYLNKRYTDKLNKEIEDLRGSYDSIFEEQRKRIKEAEAELNKGVTSTDVVNHVVEVEESKKVNYASYSKDGVKFDAETFHDKSSIKEPEPRDLENLHPVDSDEDEEEIPDPRMLVGNCLDKFSFRDSDENSIFVRNSRLGFDYEIVKVYDSYSPRGD